jgi:hypothetical protein
MRHRIPVAALIGVLSIPAAFAYETGAVCVRDFSPGITCSGNDVRIADVTVVAILEDCPAGDPSTAEASLKLRIDNGPQSRYDIGVFLSLNGNSALSGTQCLHDYLEPPLTTSPTYTDSDGNGKPDLSGGPWLDAEPLDPADECGDIAAGTDDLKTLTLRFACVDTNGDGIVDISACASWLNGPASTCPNISGATPGSGARCACDVLETGVPFPAGGRVAGLAMASSGANLSLSWSPSCSASDTDYAVYEGTLGSFTTHQSVVCSTGGATSATIAPSPGDGYYLVVPRTASKEGSYGRRSGGTERPAAASACVPQQPSGCN